MLKLYLKNGWNKVRHNRSSHVQMKKDGKHETIPMHKELSKGIEAKLLKRLKE